MTLIKIKLQAITLREQGLSYSAIKTKLGVSKSTLSIWLRDLPLSKEQINNLRANSPRRIEKFRSTMQSKRLERQTQVINKAKIEIGQLSKREIIIAGYFLYWGEGGKTNPYTSTLANTDPDMVIFYLRWLSELGVSRSKIRIRLHLYSDMNVDSEVQFWQRVTGIPLSQFRKPETKLTLSSGITRKGYGHGTCDVIVGDRDFTERILAVIKVLQEKY